MGIDEQPEIPSPFRRVEFPPWPDDGIIPGASAEAVMGLSLLPEFPAGQSAGVSMAAIIDHYMAHGLPAEGEPVTTEQPEPRGAFGQLAQLYAPLIVGTMTALTEVRKMTSVVSVSAEELADAEGMREAEQQMIRLLDGTATPEERAEAAARRAAWQADRDRRHAAAVTEWEQVRARYADQPAVTAVLDIHQPTDRLECAHPVFGYEGDDEDWPCSTFEAIRDAAQ